MTIVFNLLCKAFIAILDILLLDFYLKNVYPDIYQNKLKKTKYILYSFVFIGLIISSNVKIDIYIYIITFITLIFILHHWKISIKDCIKKLILFVVIKTIIYCITNLIFSWVFNTMISFDYAHFSTPYVLFVQCAYNFIIYLLLIIILKLYNTINLKKFKILSISIFIYFNIAFLINNDTLFRIPAIARTYIFTVVISIIALICFDRMQTKYEKDKHLQESIIQNLEKEKEFNQQREQQQKEIRKINHNLNNILIILQSHLEKEEYEEAKDYIEQNLKTHVEAYQALTHTGIAAIDGALNAHIQSINRVEE